MGGVTSTSVATFAEGLRARTVVRAPRLSATNKGVDKVSIWVGVTQVGQGKETSTHLDALGGIAYKQTEGGGRGGSETVGKRRADRSDSFERFAVVDLCTYNCAVGLTLNGRPRRSGETTESRRGWNHADSNTRRNSDRKGRTRERCKRRRQRGAPNLRKRKGVQFKKKMNRGKKRTEPGNETLQID